MARIGFLPLFDAKSHVNATFGLAKALRAEGHQVSYLATPDLEEHIRAERFDVRLIGASLFPKGFQEQKEAAPQEVRTIWTTVMQELTEALIRGDFDEVVRGSQLDLLIVDSYAQELALVAYKVGVPTVLISPTLPRVRHSWLPPGPLAVVPDSLSSRFRIRFWWWRYDLHARSQGLARRLLRRPKRRIERLVAATNYPREYLDTSGLYPILTRIPELILCPRAFDLPRPRDKYRHLHYIGGYVDQHRSEITSFPWDKLREDKRLIYASLGTSVYRFAGAREFFQVLLDAMSTKPDWQLVLSVGSKLSLSQFQQVPDNVLLVNNAPQLELLRRATIMITHAGFNSVKESIMQGVPMIVFPWHGRYSSAVRVVYHGLGLMGNFETADAQTLCSMIDTVDGDPAFRARTEAMRKHFIEIEEVETGVRTIEQFLEPALSQLKSPKGLLEE